MNNNSIRKQRIYNTLRDLHFACEQRVPTLSRPICIEDLSSYKKNFLDCLYRYNLVDVSWFTRTISDKYLGYLFFKTNFENKNKLFFPKTIGSREFLEQNPFTSIIELEKNLERENLHVLKPTISFGSLGKNIIFGSRSIASYIHENSKWFGYNPFKVNNEYGQLAPEHFILTEFVKQRPTWKQYDEFRVHSYESKVVSSGSFRKWYRLPIDHSTKDQLHNFVQSFLDNLPSQTKTKQAWSFDIILDKNNDFFIVDLNTNRGTMKSWSSNMQDPDVMKAYLEHLENNRDVEFKGVGSQIIRSGLGNIEKYLTEQVSNITEASKSMHLDKEGLIFRANFVSKKYGKLIKDHKSWIQKEAPWINLEYCQTKIIPKITNIATKMTNQTEVTSP